MLRTANILLARGRRHLQRAGFVVAALLTALAISVMSDGPRQPPVTPAPSELPSRAVQVARHNTLSLQRALDMRPGSGERWSQMTSASFGFSGPGSSFECELDGYGFGACESPMVVSGLSAGPHRFRVRSGGEIRVVRWTVDSTKPALRITGPVMAGKRVSAWRFSAADTGSGLSSSECRIDHAPWQACVGNFPVGLITPGAHRFQVRAADRAGNSASVARVWTVAAR